MQHRLHKNILPDCYNRGRPILNGNSWICSLPPSPCLVWCVLWAKIRWKIRSKFLIDKKIQSMEFFKRSKKSIDRKKIDRKSSSIRKIDRSDKSIDWTIPSIESHTIGNNIIDCIFNYRYMHTPQQYLNTIWRSIHGTVL